MDSSPDTEITLGTGKLLALFFGLVVICAVFFSLGYTLGRKSEPELTRVAAAAPQSAAKDLKTNAPAAQAAQPMTFYKSVEQKDANAQLTPASTDTATDATANAPPPSADSSASAASAPPPEAATPPDPMAIPASAYFVQVAAVTKQEDAEALVDALKKKQYAAFVAVNSPSERLFRVQVGPFADIKDAEGTRSRLINDGYNPILKK
jgi:DedD protein